MNNIYSVCKVSIYIIKINMLRYVTICIYHTRNVIIACSQSNFLKRKERKKQLTLRSRVFANTSFGFQIPTVLETSISEHRVKSFFYSDAKWTMSTFLILIFFFRCFNQVPSQTAWKLWTAEEDSDSSVFVDRWFRRSSSRRKTSHLGQSTNSKITVYVVFRFSVFILKQ